MHNPNGHSCMICGAAGCVCGGPAKLRYTPVGEEVKVVTSQIVNRGNAHMAVYTSPERLYLDAEGKVVGAKDPSRATLLVGEGGTMPLQQAHDLGLLHVSEDAETKGEQKSQEGEPEKGETVQKDPKDKAVNKAPKNKAVQPQNNKDQGNKDEANKADEGNQAQENK